MANLSPAFTTTATGSGWSYSGSAIPPAGTFNMSFGEADTYPGLPSIGAFVTSVTITSRGSESHLPALAYAPNYTGQSYGTSSTDTFDPPLTANNATSIPKAYWINQYRNDDTFYSLTAVSFTAETQQVTYYLDDPAEGAEGAEMMAMLAGGF